MLSRQSSRSLGEASGNNEGKHDQADAGAQRMARLSLLQTQQRARSQLTKV